MSSSSMNRPRPMRLRLRNPLRSASYTRVPRTLIVSSTRDTFVSLNCSAVSESVTRTSGRSSGAYPRARTWSVCVPAGMPSIRNVPELSVIAIRVSSTRPTCAFASGRSRSDCTIPCTRAVPPMNRSWRARPFVGTPTAVSPVVSAPCHPRTTRSSIAATPQSANQPSAPTQPTIFRVD